MPELEPEMTRVCPQCFVEKTLKKRIEEMRPHFPNQKCSFHPRLKGVPIGDVTAIIDEVFRSNYEIGETYPFAGADDDAVEYRQEGDDLEQIVYEITGADDKILQAVVSQLIEDDDYWPPDGGEPFYGTDQSYSRYRSGDYGHSEIWRNFCQSVMHEQRFFNTSAKDLIAEIFEGVHLQRDIHRLSPVYVLEPAGEHSVFYRARLANETEKQKRIAANPAAELGCPPQRHRRAGRMNPSGVAVFYGAFDLDTCVAELRPGVGSTVIGAKFELIRPVCVIDTTRFSEPGKELSLFAKDHMRRVAQWTFMRRFMDEIARPVSPSDEHLDYIPTQAVAEYLANHYEFHLKGKAMRIEAIIYRSAQYPTGKNIALLGGAAHMEMPEAASRGRSSTDILDEFLPETMANFQAGRSAAERPAIRLARNSVEVRRVTSARFTTAGEMSARLASDDADF